MKKPIGVFFADTHLSESTIEINKFIWKQADELAIKLGVPLFHGGDVFTARKAQPLVVLTAFQKILDELKSKVNFIPGNHDKVDLNSRNSYLDQFCHHPKVQLYRYYGSIPLGNDIHLHMLPYFKEDEKYSEYLKELLDDNVVIEKGKQNILLTHIAIDGVPNNDSSVVLNNLNQDLFGFYDLVLIGHYHQRKELGDNMLYIGSAYQNDFGEDYQKGFMILYNDLSFEFVNSKFPQYVTIKIDLDTILEEEITAFHKTYQNSSDFIRFVVTGKEEKRKAFDKTKYESVGIKVVFKDTSIETEIEKASKGKFVSFNKYNIGDQFKEFCIKENLDYNHGIKYLKEQLQ